MNEYSATPQPIDYILAQKGKYIDLAIEHVNRLYPYLSYHKPAFSELPPGTIIGTWAYSIPGKLRFILNRKMEVAPGVLPADLSRAWIRDEYKLPLRRRKNQMERGYKVPLLATRGQHGACSYIDIEHAYLSILSFGYDLEYLQGKYLGCDPRPVPDEIARNKFSYSIAVTMSGSVLSNLEVMGNEGSFTRNPLNLFSNPCLYNLANDTLHAIASEVYAVLKDKIVYINTDGFVVREGYERYVIDIVRSWGFNARIKMEKGELLNGETTIRGVASWKIGNHKTKRFDKHAHDFCNLKMDKDQRRWLKTRVAKFNRMINSENTTD